MKLLDMESLKERRSKLCLKFAKKCLKIENFKKLFPHKKTKHDMKKRNAEKFLINNIVTERYKRSSIPVIKKMLKNESRNEKRKPFTLLKVKPANDVIALGKALKRCKSRF